MNPNSQLSACHKAPVKLNKPNAHRGETVYYICQKCGKACDIYVWDNKQTINSQDELIEFVIDINDIKLARLLREYSMADRSVSGKALKAGNIFKEGLKAELRQRYQDYKEEK